MKALPEKLEGQFVIALTNLRLAALSADFLLEAMRAGVKDLPTQLVMKGPRRSVRLPSTNCGFFVTPVIHSALLDVRRTLEFFLLRLDKAKGEFVTAQAKKYPDDFAITDLGLAPVDPVSLLGLSISVIGGAPTKCLIEALTYTNKDMAHFSEKQNQPDLQGVIDSTKVIHEAILVFVYDALGIARPNPQPTVHEEE